MKNILNITIVKIVNIMLNSGGNYYLINVLCLNKDI